MLGLSRRVGAAAPEIWKGFGSSTMPWSRAASFCRHIVLGRGCPCLRHVQRQRSAWSSKL